MPRFLGRLSFSAVLGGVVCTLGATAPAGAQNTNAQLNRSEVVLSTGTGSPVAKSNHLETFAAFEREIGADDLAARKEAITGRPQSRVDWKTLNHTSIGLKDEEWNATYSILLDGSQRVANWGDAMQEALGWQDGRFEADPSQRSVAMARFDRLSGSGDSIVDETMNRLRQQLGDDAYNKLDAFVYQREGGQRVIDRGPIRRGPVETAQVTPTPED